MSTNKFDPSQYGLVDRRVVNPPIQVEMAAGAGFSQATVTDSGCSRLAATNEVRQLTSRGGKRLARVDAWLHADAQNHHLLIVGSGYAMRSTIPEITSQSEQAV
jgi:hypothetical protein